MKIYDSEGVEVPYTSFNFPDGQPHISLSHIPVKPRVTIETAIRNTQELFEVMLVQDILLRNYKSISLNIRYLLGARMDRPISDAEPNTLRTVGSILRNAPFYSIRVLDPHSAVTGQHLYSEAVYPIKAIDTVLDHYDPDYTWVMAPDKGSQERVRKMLRHRATAFGILEGFKTRDMATGKLSGFGVKAPSPTAIRGKSVLIVDDICDGGGTFAGMAAVLRDAGATSVNLFVTHGIFSKGLPIPGIDHVWTTDSYYSGGDQKGLTVLPVSMQDL